MNKSYDIKLFDEINKIILNNNVKEFITFYNNDCNFMKTFLVANSIINYGRLEMLQFLKKNNCLCSNHNLLETASCYNNIEIVDYLFKCGYKLTTICTNNAIVSSNFETFDFLLTLGCPIGINTFYDATQDVDCLQHMINKCGYLLSEDSYDKILQYARNKNRTKSIQLLMAKCY